MWLCARCGGRKPSPLSECEICASAEAIRPSLPHAHCPACGADVSGPPILDRLVCPTCRREFPDYGSWLLQCRAAAYAAHPARAIDAPFQPGPPPEGLRRVALVFFGAAAVQILGGLVWSDVLIPCLLLAALQAFAAAALLRALPRADRWARLAAGLSALIPVFAVPAAWWVWVFHYFSRPESVEHFGPPADPSTARRRQRVVGWLLGLAVAGLAAHALFLQPALQLAEDWDDPLSPLLAVGDFLRRFVSGNLLWILPGALAGLVSLQLLGSIRRRSYAWAAGLATLVLLLPLLPAIEGLRYTRRAAAAIAMSLERDPSRLLWALKEPDANLRLVAARRLGSIGREARSAAPALARSLEDRDSRIRFAAATSLAVLRPDSDRAVAILAEALHDPRRQDHALRALTAFGPRARPALPALIARLERDGASVPLLVELGASAVPALAEKLRSSNPDARRRALDVLRRAGPAARSAAPAVEAALQDPEPAVRAEAVRAYGELQRDKALPRLLDLLRHDPLLRGPAAEALCALGEREGLQGSPSPGNGLNAVRQPAQWDHLRRIQIDEDFDGTAGEILEEFAARTLLCAELTPAVEPLLLSVHRFYGSVRKRSALDVLLALDLSFVLEEERIRILTPAQAAEFWANWLYEAKASRRP